MIQIALIEVGGWSQNLARNYFQNPNCNLKYIRHLDEMPLSEGWDGQRVVKLLDAAQRLP